jgi:hypothetical protein
MAQVFNFTNVFVTLGGERVDVLYDFHYSPRFLYQFRVKSGRGQRKSRQRKSRARSVVRLNRRKLGALELSYTVLGSSEPSTPTNPVDRWRS